jgi:outer membrane protein assembly factor BamB
VVYAGSDKLYALDASTGGLLWSYDTGQVASSPTVANAVVYAGSYSGIVYAFGLKPRRK